MNIQGWFPLGLTSLIKLWEVVMDRESWHAALHGVTKSHTRLSDWTEVTDGCESWTIKKAEWRIIDAFEMVLEKILESPLELKEIKLVNPKGNQPWIFIGRTYAEAETPILWPPDVKNWLNGEDPNAGKDWREEDKGMTEDEMIGWHHWLDGHEFEQVLGVGGGAAAARSLQSRPTLCDPIDSSPPGSSVPGSLQARILEWVAISLSNACMHAKMLQLCPTLCDPMDNSPQGSSVHRIL